LAWKAVHGRRDPGTTVAGWKRLIRLLRSRKVW
jgi:hypothetical protein